VSVLAVQMTIATVAGPAATWALRIPRISWHFGLGAYMAGAVLSHVGPFAGTYAGGVLLVIAAIALGQGLRDVDPAVRFLYLFAAMPPMDLLAAWFLSTGRGDLGVVMVIGSLPIGVASLVAAWRWMLEEESRAA
jgi:hypothetical protein